MLAFFRENPRAFLAAIVVHLVLLAILVYSMDWTPSVSTKGAKQAPIKAVVVDAKKLSAEIDRQQEAKLQQQKREQEKLKQLELQAEEAKKAREQEEKRLAELQKQQQDARRKAELEAKQRAEAKLKLQQQAKRKAELEQKRKAEEKRKADAQRKKEEQRIAEEKRTAEKKRIAEKRKAEEKRLAEEKRKAEQQARRKAAAEAERKAAEAALQASLAAEQEELEGQRVSKEVNRYIAYIQDKVQRSWIRPPDSGTGMTCLVGVKLIPSGEVIEAKILRSSGNAAFDRSVEAAVFKASPLPVPQDQKIMARFRSFNFVFKPS